MSTPRTHKPVPNRLALSLLLALVAGDASADNHIWITAPDDPDPVLSTGTCSLRQAINRAIYPNPPGIGNCVMDGGGVGGTILEMVPWLSNSHLMLEHGELFMNFTGFQGASTRVILRGHGLVIDAHQASRVIRYQGGTFGTEHTAVVLQDVTLTGGRVASSEMGGGALVRDLAELYLVRSRVTGNEAGWGGGIAARGMTLATTVRFSTVALFDSSVDNNTADRGGGIHLTESGGFIVRSTISDNVALQGGGAGVYALQVPPIEEDSKSLNVWNSTISGNTTLGSSPGYYYSGSAIRGYGQDISLNHATITGNHRAWGAAIDMWGGEASITNSIISGNDRHPETQDWPNYNPDFNNLGGGTTVSHSILGTRFPNIPGVGNVFTDTPLLDALVDNGGFAPTHLPLADSPALDFGDDTACATLLPYRDSDFVLAPSAPFHYLVTTAGERSVSRPQGAHCDAGAVERRQGNFTIAANASGQGRIDASPLPSGAGSSGGISDCTSAGGAACGATYVGENDIATLTFTATPATGWHLDAWSGDCIASMVNASARLAVDGDRVCNAGFAIDTHTIGGSVQGLAGSGLVLQLNGANDLPIAGDGHFEFAPVLEHGTPYTVAIAAQPDGQTCFIPHGSGTADGDVDVAVICGNVPIAVAVSVAIDDGAALVLPGDTPTYAITVDNDGDDTAYGVSLATSVTPTGALDALAWTCNGDCSAAGGSGDVAVSVDVPAHAQVTVLLHGTVGTFSGAALDVSAQVTLPDWYIDTTGTHAATDSNANQVIFRNGFDGVN